MVVKVFLELKLLSATKIAGDHLLTLNLKNIGRSILKNLVVKLQSSDPKFSVDCKGCFVYALMPNTDQTVKFRTFVSSLGGAYFLISGYVSGDQYFSIESPVISLSTRNAVEKDILSL